MALEERVYSVLIVSASEKFMTSLAPLLPETNFSPVTFANGFSSAKKILLERHYDLLIINTPLIDDFGTKLAIDASNEKGVATLLLVKRELYDETYSKVFRFGVFTLSKPTTPQSFQQALDWLCAMREKLRKFEKTISSVEDKMQEIRLVNRAKWILIDVLKMTEEDAHYYIEKQAMDRCMSKAEIAKNIINTYK